MREIEFLDALKRVEKDGLCSLYTAGQNVWHGEPCKGFSWGIIGQEVVKTLPGLVFVSSHGGISWVCGKGGSRAAFVPTGQWVDMAPGREVIRELLGGVNILRFCTPGKAASLLLRFAADRQWDSAGSELLLDGVQYGYHDCKPGVYPHVVQYDVSGYYYTMLDKALSLRVNPYKKGVEWDMLSPWEQSTWNDIKSAVRDVKILRNSMVGVMAGSRKPYTAFARTPTGVKTLLIKGKVGPFRSLAYLIVRTGWELCRSESLQVNSVYSTIDCVTSCHSVPSVWERFGFRVKPRYKGPGDIRCRGVYKIGSKHTEWYREGNGATPFEIFGQGEVLPAPGVPHYYTLDWLEPIGGLYGLQTSFPC